MLSAEAAAKRYTWLQGEIAKQVVAQMDFGFKRKSVNITPNNVETEQEVKGLDKLWVVNWLIMRELVCVTAIHTTLL